MKSTELPRKTIGVVLPDWHTVFVVTPKAGCTSFLWMMAGLQGEDLGRFRRSVLSEVTQALTIHDWTCWQRTRVLDRLSDAELAVISPDNAWLIFCVTRHPLSRLWSAWQSKLLLREPRFVKLFGAADWFPRVPHDADEVARDFRRFVVALRNEPSLITADPHWMPQHLMLNVAGVPYTHIGKTETLTETLDVLRAHLRAQGWAGDIPQLHENRSPLPLSEDLLCPEVVETIEQLYRADYACFGYSIEDPTVHDVEGGSAGLRGPGGEMVFRALSQLISRHERIDALGTMAAAAMESARAALAAGTQLSHELDEARGERAALEDRLRELQVGAGTGRRDHIMGAS